MLVGTDGKLLDTRTSLEEGGEGILLELGAGGGGGTILEGIGVGVALEGIGIGVALEESGVGVGNESDMSSTVVCTASAWATRVITGSPLADRNWSAVTRPSVDVSVLSVVSPCGSHAPLAIG